MQSLVITWRLLLLAGLFVFPQLAGILLYFRLRRVPRWMARVAAALAPAVIYFWLDRIFLMRELREAYAHGERCGMPALGAVLLLFAATIIHLLVGVLTQIAWSVSSRNKIATP
jgi:hypothetical protein